MDSLISAYISKIRSIMSIPDPSNATENGLAYHDSLLYSSNETIDFTMRAWLSVHPLTLGEVELTNSCILMMITA